MFEYEEAILLPAFGLELRGPCHHRVAAHRPLTLLEVGHELVVAATDREGGGGGGGDVRAELNNAVIPYYRAPHRLAEEFSHLVTLGVFHFFPFKEHLVLHRTSLCDLEQHIIPRLITFVNSYRQLKCNKYHIYQYA